MNVNSQAFKYKCRFIATLRYELFLSLSVAAGKFPHELIGLRPWTSEVAGLLKSLSPALRAGAGFSSVVASFFPAMDASLSPEEMFRYLESMDPEVFLSLFLKGLIHDEDVCEQLAQGRLSLKQAVNQTGAQKREWLSHLGLYPFRPGEPAFIFFQWLLADRVDAKTQLIQMYRQWWEVVFSRFWAAHRTTLAASAKNHHKLFEKMEFEEFSGNTLLKIRLGTKGDSLEAMRGGYKISCVDINAIYFLPSLFNTDRIWSAIDRPGEKPVLYFPYLDLELLAGLGAPAPKSRLDPALMCRALGDPTRYALLTLLSREAMPAVALAEKLDLTRATVSHHVSMLREAGVLTDTGEGRRLQIHWSNLSLLSNSLITAFKK